VTVIRRLAVAVSALAVLAGCTTQPVDYRAIWSSSSTAPTTTQAPISMSQYLQGKGVDGAPMTPQTLTELTVSIPHPPGWAVVTDPNQKAVFEILRKTAVSAYQPTALLFVFKLTGGNFDVNDALTHAYDMPGAKIEPFHGMPSSMIEATYYESKGQQVHRYNRIVFATAKSKQLYLVQFSVTAAADPTEEQDPDIVTIIKGFTVAPT
jgi:hypothetical protein